MEGIWLVGYVRVGGGRGTDYDVHEDGEGAAGEDEGA
jgi:hypothetical protein